MSDEIMNRDPVHNLIAARLVFDPDFFAYMMKDSKEAFKDTLDKGGIKYEDALLKELVGELQKFIADHGKHAILASCRNYLTGGDVALLAI